MNESVCCPKCGIQLTADSPAGLCPKCLVQAGFESESFPHSKPGPTTQTPPTSGFVPPTVEEVAPLFPQLEILELLGKGGMGAVYKARQPGLDRLVAVKILPPEISRDPAFTERFQREARALARLSHPHIVAVYDFGVVAQASLCYIVMEFVDGANLRQAIRTGKLTSAEALAIVPQICEALQFAHDEGIVHRDIKPENILIDKRGRVKIADFGLAKLVGQHASDHSLTATHQVMGTLRYMAPEQLQGSREVDHRADIYSLGVVFYELLTGELPMGKFAPPSKRVQVDVRLDEIVLRALEQDPEQRYQHASEVKTDVDAISRSPHFPSAHVGSSGDISQRSANHWNDMGRISLWASISGVVLPAALLIGGIMLSNHVSIPDGFVLVCFILGVGLELVAVGCGIVSKRTSAGKAGLIIGSVLLVLWMATLLTIPVLDVEADGQPESIIESNFLPPLGTITSGIGAQFIVPAGQVAVFEVVTRRDGETVPVPPHCGYVMASPDAPVVGTFRWSPMPQESLAGSHGRTWRLEIVTDRVGSGITEALLLPEELNNAVGARSLQLGLLAPNEEVVHWGHSDVRDLPADGLIGFRVTVVPHGMNGSGSGNAHIDWKNARPKTSTTRRKLLGVAPEPKP